MAIVISALGSNIEILAELLGYINQDVFSFYKQHAEYAKIYKDYKNYFQGKEANELWVYSTTTPNTKSAINRFLDWKQALQIPVTCRFWLFLFQDINSYDTAQQAKELAVRLVAQAHKKAKDAVYISLAAGRKTMTTDLAWAGSLFGCSGFIHILSNGTSSTVNTFTLERIKSVDTIIDADIINNFYPYYDGRANKNSIVIALERKYSKYLRIPEQDCIIDADPISANDYIINQLELMLNQAGNAHSTLTDDTRLAEIQHTFPFLAMYNSESIQKLKDTPVTIEFAQALPKIDLHCHLGGVLSIPEIVSIARETLYREYKIKSLYSNKYDYTKKIDMLKKGMECIDYKERLEIIASFYDRENELEQLWYDKYLDAREFAHIGFVRYEQLGNLQGSTLLQSKTALELTIQKLLKNYKDQNALGLEIRCSPYNYTQAGLSVEEVINIILTTIDEQRGNLEVGLIFIASRHKKMSEVYRSIELYDKVKKENVLFNKYFHGFDVAGNEEARRPSELREAFMSILKDCINITIHAGEIQDAQSIWEAIYYLNADRIGHGLSLAQSDDTLKKKFLNREIAIELCPSSNFQIVDDKTNGKFNDYKLNQTSGTDYPLKEFLRQGFKVTINTDNPGISRTSITNEFIKAAAMCPPHDKLSMFDAMQLVKNSIEKSFFPYDIKQKLLNRASATLKEEVDKVLSL